MGNTPNPRKSSPNNHAMDILEAILYAVDLNAAEAFYCRLLDRPPVVKQEGRHVFFRLDSTMLLIFNPQASEHHHTDDDHPIPCHGSYGEGHVAFRVLAETLDHWRQRLAELEIAIEQQIDWPHGATSIYFRDPANNSIELATPSLWEFNENS